MWSTTNCLGSNKQQCLCHTSMVPCSCTNPMTQYWNHNVPDLTSFLNYQSAPRSTIYGFSHASINPVNPLFHAETNWDAGVQMATNEIDYPWLLPNPCYYQVDGSLSHTTYCSWTGSQVHGHFDDHYMQPQGIQVNYDKYYGQSSREAGLMEQQGIHQNDYSTYASLLHVRFSHTVYFSLLLVTCKSFKKPTYNSLKFIS